MEYEKVSSSTMELLKNDMKNNYEVIMKKNTDSNGRPVAKRIENEIKKVYNGIIVLTQIPNEFYRVRIDGMVEITENRELKENEYRVDYISGKVYFNPVKEGQDIKVSLYYGDGVELIPTSRIYIGLNRYGEPVKTLHEVLKESIDSLDALNKVGGVIKEGDRLNNTLNTTINNANSTDNKVNETIETANATNNTLNSTIKNSENHNNILNETIINSESKNNTLNNTIETSMEKNSVLNDTINNANSTNNKVNETISNADTHNNTLNNTIIQANKTNDKVNETIESANSTDNKVKITTDNARVMDNILNETIKDSKTKNSDLNETIINSVEKDNVLKSTIETANSTNTKVDGTIKIANETNSVLGTSIKRFTDSNNTLNDTVNSANLTNDKVNKTIGVADATNNIVNSTIGNAENINNTLGATITKAETDNKTLNDTINTAETKNTNLTKTISDSDTTKANLETTINNAKSNDDTLKVTIDNANNSNTTLNNTINDSVGKNSSLANTISQVKNNNDTLIATIDRANSTNNTLNNTNNTAKATKTELDKSISEAKTVIGNTNDLLTGVQTNKKDIADLKERVVKTNNYLEIDNNNSKEFRVENSLEGKTEGLKIFGNTLHNLIKGGKGTFVIDKNVSKDSRIQMFKPTHALQVGKTYKGYLFVKNIDKSKYGLKIYGFGDKKAVYGTIGDTIGVVKFSWTPTNDVETEMTNIGIYLESPDFDNGSKATFSDFMLFEEGAEPTCIDEYFEGIKSVGETEGNKINVLTRGKNCIKFDDLHGVEGSLKQYFNCYDKEFSYSVGENDKVGWFIEKKINIKKGVNLVLSLQAKSTFTDGGSGWIGIYYKIGSDYRYFGSYITTNTKYKKFEFKGIVPNEAKECSLRIYNYSKKSGSAYFKEIQIEEGTQSTEFEDYREDKTEILLKEPLRKGDYIYKKNGTVSICRLNKSYTFSGEETWALGKREGGWGEYEDTLVFYIPSFNEANVNTNFLCNNFAYNNIVSRNGIGIYNAVWGNSPHPAIRIKKTELQTKDIEGFKKWLKSNPTTIIYQLAMPIEEVIESSSKLDLNTYKNLTYIASRNIITPKINCKLPKNLVTTVQETTNRINDLEKIMYGVEGLNSFEGKGEYLQYDNTSTGFINNCVIEGKTLENLFDINNSFVYADINDYYYHEMDIRENNLDVNKVYSAYYENLNTAYSCGSIIFFKDKTTNISEVSFNPNTWEKFTIPKETKYLLYRGLRKSAKYTEHNNGFRFTVLEGDWTNKNAPQYFYGYGSIGEKSKNLFKGEIESGSVDMSSKKEIEDCNKFRTNFITILPNTYYTLSFKDVKGGTSLIVSEYDYNKNIIKTSTIGNQQSFLTDIRSVYIKVIGENERVENIQVEEGKKATVFEYGYEGYKIRLNSFSKNNLWSKGLVTLCSLNTGINYYDLKDINNIRITNTNEATYNYVYFNVEHLKPNTSYTLGFDCEINCGFPYVTVREIEEQYRYDANKTTPYRSVNCNSNKRYTVTFTTGSNIGKNKIVTVGFYSTTERKTKTDCCFKNIVLAETKEYKDDSIRHDFDEKNLVIKEPLRSLNGLSDKIEKIDGNYKVNRIIGQKRLDGSENWIGWKVNDKYCCFLLMLNNAEGDWTNQKLLKCNKMTNDASKAYYQQIECCALDENGQLYMCIEKAKLKTPDVNGFKAWLQNNVVNILYKLRIPVIEDLLGSDRPNLKVYNGSTIINTLSNTIVPAISFEIPRNLSEIVRNNTDTIKENSESAKTISSAIAKNSINIMINKNTEKVLTSKIVQTTINLNKTNTSLNSFVNQKNQEITTINKKLVELDGLLIASTTAPENLNALWLDITD
ncbi:hypothetical protein P5F71_07660 [Clostridium perfringens]|nr:hypothetical protein [Clostridium perfringens]